MHFRGIAKHLSYTHELVHAKEGADANRRLV